MKIQKLGSSIALFFITVHSAPSVFGHSHIAWLGKNESQMWSGLWIELTIHGPTSILRSQDTPGVRSKGSQESSGLLLELGIMTRQQVFNSLVGGWEQPQRRFQTLIRNF
jgi:hypothetical protein